MSHLDRLLAKQTTSTPTPMVCPICEGNSELVRCPPTCDGSHIQDEPYPCPDCNSTGEVPN